MDFRSCNGPKLRSEFGESDHSQEKGIGRELILGDGTFGVRKRDFEMLQELGNVGVASVRVPTLRRRTTPPKCCADMGLRVAEPPPKSMQRASTESSLHRRNRRRDSGDNHPPQKIPQGACSQDGAMDFLGEPDGEGASAAVFPPSIAAKNSLPKGDAVLSVRVGTMHGAVPNEVSDDLTVGTGSEFELLTELNELRVVTIKTSWFGHIRLASVITLKLPESTKCEVVARLEKSLRKKKRGRTRDTTGKTGV